MSPSLLLTTVIAMVALVGALSWVLMATPLAIYKQASKRFAIANFFVAFGMLWTMLRLAYESGVLWFVSDLAMFFALFYYKHAVYLLFRLPNNGLFDKTALIFVAVIGLANLLFAIEYRHVSIAITLIGAVTGAFAAHAKYHALIRYMSKFIAACMTVPILIVTFVLFVRSLSLWLIPNIAQEFFLHPQFDSFEILWVYLVMVILINVAATGAALMLLITKIKDLAEHDQLTGLLNRHAISRDLDYANKLYKRNNTPFSVLLIDLDFFKQVNDTKGHDAGDAAIRHVSQIMRNELRETDRLSRYGGEEFLALLSNCGLEHAYKVAENLRTEIESAPLLWEGEDIHLTISTGVCNINQVSDTKELVRCADQALYSAKSSGRNKTLLAQ